MSGHPKMDWITNPGKRWSGVFYVCFLHPGPVILLQNLLWQRQTLLFFQVNSIIPKLLADNDVVSCHRKGKKLLKTSLDISNNTLQQLERFWGVPFNYFETKYGFKVSEYICLYVRWISDFLSMENQKDSCQFFFFPGWQGPACKMTWKVARKTKLAIKVFRKTLWNSELVMKGSSKFWVDGFTLGLVMLSWLGE